MNVSTTLGIFTLVLSICCTSLKGQSPVVFGAEIFKVQLGIAYAELDVAVFTRHAPKDSIFLDWGDGYIGLYQSAGMYLPTSELYVSLFYVYHYYDEPGYYTIELIEREIADSVINIPNSGDKAMILRDTILTPDTSQSFIYLNANTMMMSAGGYPFVKTLWDGSAWNDEDGTQIYEQRCHCVNPQVGYLEYSLEPFPAEGAEPLPATNSVHIEPVSYNKSVLVWDKPVAPGRYGFGVKIRQFMRDLENPTDTTLLATTLRAVILDIDSTMTLTPVSMPGIEGFVSLYPNPASDYLDLQLGGFRAPVQVHIFNALGQVVYETQADDTRQVSTVRISVATWPQGVYSVQLQTEGKTLTRQVAVQR